MQNQVVYNFVMLTYEYVFWLLACIFVFSLIYPWHPGWPGAKFLTHTTLLLFPAWFAYETAMPKHMNIRLDIPLIVFGVAASLGVYVFRLCLFANIRRSDRRIVEPHRNIGRPHQTSPPPASE